MDERLPGQMQMVYKNHRGEMALRNIVPQDIFFGETRYHDGEQWFLTAMDVDKGEVRHFALRDCNFPEAIRWNMPGQGPTE